MFGGNSSNYVHPNFVDENRFGLNANAPNPQLQLFGNLPIGCTVDPVNYFGNAPNSSNMRPSKRGREVEDLSRQQKLQISLNYDNLCQDEVDRNPNQHPVSTGLKLSYDEDEHNSSVTSASGSITASPPVLLSLGNNITSELQRQKDEFEHFIKIQEEQLAKGVREMKQRHVASFLNTIKEGVSKKLREKETELENMNRKNQELAEKIKQVATEAHNWHYRAKYNESMVNLLKNNLQTAMSLGAINQGKEGFGDSEVDDAATSYADPTKGKLVSPEHLTCKACKSREVCVLLMPCRHLCVCRECDGFVSVCPMCNIPKSASVEVYLS